MVLRFGSGRQGDVARIVSAVATIVQTILRITYFSVGTGIFINEFMGIPDLGPFKAEFIAGASMTLLATIYTVTSGIHGVVWTDVMQSLLIFVTILYGVLWIYL